ncbi:MAG: CRISPR-associated endonuclease Cas1, partial [Deferribacteraceae bacterium]|nr:CRISPR-associated endonuclease Cas1 [Deferribacteraceae bacterium]
MSRQGSYVRKERETIVVEHEREKVLQVPIHALSGIFCFGNVLVSPFVYELCSESGASLCFFTEYGRFIGRMQGRMSGNILLRRKQYEQSRDNPVGIAANIVAAKLNASRKVLLRQLRTGDNEIIAQHVNVMKSYLDKLKTVDNLETVRGIEGEAAARYFSVFNELITNKDFAFNGRSRRPPLDPVNAMLSFMYAIVGKDISAALEGVGLDPQA